MHNVGSEVPCKSPDIGAVREKGLDSGRPLCPDDNRVFRYQRLTQRHPSSLVFDHPENLFPSPIVFDGLPMHYRATHAALRAFFRRRSESSLYLPRLEQGHLRYSAQGHRRLPSPCLWIAFLGSFLSLESTHNPQETAD